MGRFRKRKRIKRVKKNSRDVTKELEFQIFIEESLALFRELRQELEYQREKYNVPEASKCNLKQINEPFPICAFISAFVISVLFTVVFANYLMFLSKNIPKNVPTNVGPTSLLPLSYATN